MNETWHHEPTLLKVWPDQVNYALFVDESGTASIPRREKSLNEWRKHPQYFSLAGVMIDRNTYFDELKPTMINFKSQFWPPSGFFQYPQGVRRVVLHSREIRRQTGPFSRKLVNIPDLYQGIADMVNSINFVTYAAVLNLRNLDGALPTATLPFKHQPYSLAMHFLLERYAQYLRTRKESGIVVLEARGKVDDQAVLNDMLALLSHKPREFYCIKGIYWVSKWAEWDAGRTSFGAIELADLIAYPVSQWVSHQHKTPAFEIIEPKLYGYPNYLSKGLKIF